MALWEDLKVEFEEALKWGYVEEALSHLDALITSASSPSDIPNLLENHRVGVSNSLIFQLGDLPTLHHLARFPFQEEDIPHLNRLIRIFTVCGYDLNKMHPSRSRQRATRGFTALLASVCGTNVILLECLLRHGARADFPDQCGLSPAYWAIREMDLKCLEKLVEFGGASALASTTLEKNGIEKVRPLLHTAVDLDRVEIVSYLLGLEELGVDVNEEAKYSDGLYTALGRAQFKLQYKVKNNANLQIIEILMTPPGTKASRFKELDTVFEKDPAEEVLSFLKYFSGDELSSHKIGDKLALHCLDSSVFFDNDWREFTKEVILEYVRWEWDPNSVCKATMDYGDLSFNSYTLLHLACMAKALDIVKVLVEEVGVNLNCITEGELELTPLHISLMEGDWEGAPYLIDNGADLNVRGSDPEFTRVMRRNLTTGNLELDSTFNSVELLMAMGCNENLPLLDKVLASPDFVWHGSNEFQLAMDGNNPEYILKVLQRCAEIISKEDLNWITVCEDEGEESPAGKPQIVPSLVWLFDVLPAREGMEIVVDLIKLFAQLGYNMNSCWRKSYSGHVEKDPLIFKILKCDLLNETSNRLLRTILQVDHLQLNVTNEYGENLVEYLWHRWNKSCIKRRTSMCLETKNVQRASILEAFQLLVTHGLDVSGMTVGGFFIFHQGSEAVLKMLCRAGVKISNEFFGDIQACKKFPGGPNAAAKEIEEFKEWKESFDQENESRFTLKHICRFRVRKMLKCVGDLKMLDELPKSLKEAVLGTSHL